MNIETIKSVYFVGAGGIGMSALVRYFLSKGKVVAGIEVPGENGSNKWLEAVDAETYGKLK